MTQAIKSDLSGDFAASPEPPSPVSSPFPGGGGTSAQTDKPPSGYQRQKLRHYRLIAEHKALREQHQQLTLDHEELLAAFAELKSLNDELASNLRRARQRPPVPAFASVLMGIVDDRH